MAVVIDGTTGITAPAATIAGTVSGSPVQGGLVSGTAVASTSGTAVDFTGIPSWAKRITVMLAETSISGTSDMVVQLGSASGFETTGYTGSGLRFSTTGIGGASYANGIVIDVNAASFLVSGSLVISNISGNLWVANGNFGGLDGSNIAWMTAGSKELSDTLTQIRITTGNGTDTFDGGSINIMYEG